MPRVTKGQQAAHSYDELKEFAGRKYTGMKVGRGHKWQYAAGEWVEKKLTPDEWEFRYAVNKQRHGRAPEGSGVPVGTAYHWYILADQTVTKLDANTYSTNMWGTKYKLAHQRADKASWSASERAQRKRLIQLLEKMLAELRAHPEGAELQPGATATAVEAPPAPARPKRRPVAAARAAKGKSKRPHPPARAAGARAADGQVKGSGARRISPTARTRRRSANGAAAHA